MEFTGRTDLPYRYTIRDWLFSIGDITTTSYPFSAYYEYENNGNVYRTEYCNGSVGATYKRYRYRYRYSHTYDNLTCTYASGTNRMASVSCTTKGVPACTGILSACEACSEPHRPPSEWIF
jgi:hypothetical protein